MSGNVEKLDATSTVPASQCSLSRTDSDSPFSEDERISSEHDYAGWMGNNSHVILNATSYIAGWIVRTITPQINCVTCQSTLISPAIPIHSGHSFHLIEIKNNGGLVIPSSGVVTIIHLTEKAIQQLMNIHSIKNTCSFRHILTRVREAVGSQDILLMGDHIINTQHGIDNHFTSLLFTIVHKYYDLRQHHIAKVYHVRKQVSSLRHKFNKLVLFKGE